MLLGRLFRSKWSELLYTYTLTTKTAMQCRSLQLLTNNNGQDVKPLASFSLFFLLSCNCKTVMLLRPVISCIIRNSYPYQLHNPTRQCHTSSIFFLVRAITAVVQCLQKKGTYAQQIKPVFFLYWVCMCRSMRFLHWSKRTNLTWPPHGFDLILTEYPRVPLALV